MDIGTHSHACERTHISSELLTRCVRQAHHCRCRFRAPLSVLTDWSRRRRRRHAACVSSLCAYVREQFRAHQANKIVHVTYVCLCVDTIDARDTHTRQHRSSQVYSVQNKSIYANRAAIRPTHTILINNYPAIIIRRTCDRTTKLYVCNIHVYSPDIFSLFAFLCLPPQMPMLMLPTIPTPETISPDCNTSNAMQIIATRTRSKRAANATRRRHVCGSAPPRRTITPTFRVRPNTKRCSPTCQ